MKPLSKTILLASALSCALAAPAMADWYRIGGVDVGHHRDRDVTYSRFGGGVDRLRFDTHESDVNCRSVRATFRNGTSREVFSGWLRAGHSEVVELPGDRRHVEKLIFKCRATARRGATIAISADVSSYRDEWRHSPNWDRIWSRVFHWDPRMAWNDNDWVSVGTETFEGRNDREQAVAGWSGRSVDRIAVKPLNADARCSRITARFGNGKRRDLDVDAGMRMVQGRGYTFDLPGDERNVRSVVLHCTPVDRRSVRIEVLARK
jgi:hypothetical protein